MEVVGAKAEKKVSEEDKHLGMVLLQLSQCHVYSCS